MISRHRAPRSPKPSDCTHLAILFPPLNDIMTALADADVRDRLNLSRLFRILVMVKSDLVLMGRSPRVATSA
jgi:hypothetical protein